jgi:hypothetical protein
MRARCFPCIGREHYRISLSPITAYPDGDGANLAQCTGARLVNTAVVTAASFGRRPRTPPLARILQ